MVKEEEHSCLLHSFIRPKTKFKDTVRSVAKHGWARQNDWWDGRERFLQPRDCSCALQEDWSSENINRTMAEGAASSVSVGIDRVISFLLLLPFLFLPPPLLSKMFFQQSEYPGSKYKHVARIFEKSMSVTKMYCVLLRNGIQWIYLKRFLFWIVFIDQSILPGPSKYQLLLDSLSKCSLNPTSD